jgi:hypothetical protein
MSFWSNPIQSTEQAISGLGKDISNIPNDVKSFVSNPKQATANLMANPFMPALIGGTASALSGGALTPLMAGLAVGGTEAAASGSIGKGLMAGIGAYGGANIANAVPAYAASSADAAANGYPSPGISPLHIATTALEAANGPNGNAILGGANVGSSAQTPTDTGSVTNSIYARNPYAAKDLNLIGAQYTQGENPDTSERKYFDPMYITPTTGLPAAGANTMTATPTATPTATTPAGANITNQVVSKAAMGGLQATPQAQMVNTPNPNAPMSHDLVDAYHRPQVQMPVPQPVMMASGGASDPMNYSSDPVTNLPADQIYAINPATHTPYAQDIAQSGLSGNGLAALIAQENAAKAAAQQSIAQDTKAASTGGSMGTSVNAYADGGGIYNLGGYSDGGRLLRGPGDGVSDSIPATIGHKQPARLADGEFVVPARIVSELGNGSTEAGARKLYAMLDRIQAARSKSVGKGNVAKNSRADKHLPA